MEKLKPRPEESPSAEEIDNKIRDLLNPTLGQEEWTEEWNNPQFAELFPNITQWLLYREYPEPDRRRIFELAFNSLMQLLLTKPNVHFSGMLTIRNNPLPKWQRADQVKRPDTESLSTIVTGSLVVLGLGLDDKESAKNLILENYEALKTRTRNDSKARGLRNNVVRLAREKNLFRIWVKTNNIDQNYEFDWDEELPNLFLRLSPFQRNPTATSNAPNKLAPELKSDLKIFPPVTIDLLSTYALGCAQNLSKGDHTSKDLREFILRVQEIDPNHFRDYPEVFDAVQNKINQINGIISPPK